MARMNDAEPNREQATYWNEEGGPRWVAMQRDLDAELEPFGNAVADRLGLSSGDDVLDVGCGAGATSLMLAERARPGTVLGVDISEPLLARARERGASLDTLRFERGDAQTFAFAENSYDAIFSRFGVMFFSDPVAAFTNLRKALRDGGRIGFVAWRAMEENPAFVVPLDAARPFLPEAPKPPVPDAPGPFAFANPQRLRDVLVGAGYGSIDVTAFDVHLVFGGRSDLEGAVDLALQVGPLSRALPSVPEASKPLIRAAVRDAFLPFHTPAGVVLPAATWIATARATP